MMKTYRIETQVAGGCWVLSHTWSGMPKGKTEGAMMVLNAMYGSDYYRAVCEQTGEVVKCVGGRAKPQPANTYEEMKGVANDCKALAKKLNLPIIIPVQSPTEMKSFFVPLENQ
jgi:hypothetical protein